jgi:hypothetical protein
LSWFKIDDGMHSHPKTLAAGNEAMGLWARCGSYCSHYLTEGRVPRAVALSYGDMNLVDILVKVDWLIHDYHDYNPTKERVLTEREAAAERQRQARERARLAREAAARKAEAMRHGVTNAVTDAVTNGVSHNSADAHDATRHGVTHAEVAATPETASDDLAHPLEGVRGIAPVQDIADAPSRRDSQQQSRAPRPDPTRPVLPTEVREEQNPSVPGALFEVAEPTRPRKTASRKTPAKDKPPVDPETAARNKAAASLTREWWDGLAQKPAGKHAFIATQQIFRSLLDAGHAPGAIAEAAARAGLSMTLKSLEFRLQQIQEERARVVVPFQRPAHAAYRESDDREYRPLSSAFDTGT